MMNTTVKMTQLHSFTEQQLCSKNVCQNANQVVRVQNDPYDSKVSSQMSKCSQTQIQVGRDLNDIKVTT